MLVYHINILFNYLIYTNILIVITYVTQVMEKLDILRTKTEDGESVEGDKLATPFMLYALKWIASGASIEDICVKFSTQV